MSLLSLLARTAIAVPFMYMGYQAAVEPGGRVQLAKDFGIPDDLAEPAVRANGAIMVLGGAAVLTGLGSRVGALAVAGAMVPTALSAHSFWNDTDPKAKAANRIQFLKNLGMVGGLLAVAARPTATASDHPHR
ncbi:MAG: DoxX family protein [Propionibacteriaceae bacterium]|mgnify:CR=1 FL=1|nr:DoxX family protein [Propionibacteriaceae bacterium]